MPFEIRSLSSMNYVNYFFLLDELVFGFATTSVHFRTIRNLTNNTKTNQMRF